MTIQRSKGYQTRPTLSVARIGELISFIKSIKPDVICMVDNCYGEFVETVEPSDVGADMVVGSLIKNPGEAWRPLAVTSVGEKIVLISVPTASARQGWARRWEPIWESFPPFIRFFPCAHGGGWSVERRYFCRQYL